MLHWRGIELFAERAHILFAHAAFIAENTDLDQFVTFQTAVDFLQDGCGQAVLADGDNRIQGVGAGAQGAALIGSNFEHSVNLYKERILPGLRR